ncbi:hypothetical protein WJX72_006500 [[Myrmecia] bisecta]|uniref:histidine kinase n=1 Tax=[Myrmecia] bisecta TaxID=41462 RepID=A0AAW1P688_9CHLO
MSATQTVINSKRSTQPVRRTLSLERAKPKVPLEATAVSQGQPNPQQVALPVSSSHSTDSQWRFSLLWTLAGASIYIALSMVLPFFTGSSKAGYKALIAQGSSLQIYQMSCAAFFSAMVIDAASLLFETNATKQQLALLGVFIKGTACYADMTIWLGGGIIIINDLGKPVILQRYIQWFVTTPTMLLLMSRLSDFTVKQVALTVVMNAVMLATGMVASLVGSTMGVVNITISMLAFMYVMKAAAAMVISAIAVQNNPDVHRGLKAIMYTTIVVWSAFPLIWFLGEMGLVSLLAEEIMTMVSSFTAKVLFSSSVMYGNFMTIAQRKRIVEELQEHENRIKMVEELKHAVKTKEDFMSMVSHELRTPLNGIIGLTEALMAMPGTYSDKAKQYMTTIKNSSYHLANIINDILDAASLKKGKLTLKLSKVYMNKVVDHVLDVAGQLAKKGVVVERFVDPQTPVIVGDSSRVQQILYNLIGNSIKFTLKGKISVRVSHDLPSESVLMVVQDTGCGVPKDKQKVIFEAFGQGDMSTTRKFGGTGLGLNIVKQLVEAHGGTITLDSEVGQGSTFTVRLPVKQSETDDRPSLDLAENERCHPSQPAPAGPSRLSGERKTFDLDERVGRQSGDKPVTFSAGAMEQPSPSGRRPSQEAAKRMSLESISENHSSADPLPTAATTAAAPASHRRSTSAGGTAQPTPAQQAAAADSAAAAKAIEDVQSGLLLAIKGLKQELEEAHAAYRAEHELRVHDAETIGTIEVELQHAKASYNAQQALLDAAEAQLQQMKELHGAAKLIASVPAGPGMPALTSHNLLAESAAALAGQSYSVRMLLQDLGLEGYAQTFENQEVNLDMLLTMSVEELKDLGVTQFGHRQIIKVGLMEFVKQMLRNCEARVQQMLSRPRSAFG